MPDAWKTLQGVLLVVLAVVFLLSGLGAFQFSYGKTQNTVEVALAFVFVIAGLFILFTEKDKAKISIGDAKVEVTAGSK